MEEWKRKKRKLERESVRKQEKMVDQYVICGGMEDEGEKLGEMKRTKTKEVSGLVRNLRKNEKQEKWKKREKWKRNGESSQAE